MFDFEETWRQEWKEQVTWIDGDFCRLTILNDDINQD